MSGKPQLNIAFRGHVRNSMSSLRLRELLEAVAEHFELHVFVHTWNVQQNSLSWRGLDEIPNPIYEQKIRYYMGGFNIKSVEIEDDKKIIHIGNTQGTIGRTKCPVLGWKNMYHGKLKVCSMVLKDKGPDAPVIQMRLDIMNNPFSPKIDEVVSFLKRDYPILLQSENDERIRFLRMRCFLGVDNMYMARADDMLRFVSYMYYDMDRILKVHRRSMNQEHIAFHERKSFLDYTLPGQSVQ